MHGELEEELRREVERLKTIESTLNYLEMSGKKQLSNYLSSNSKSASNNKHSLPIDDLAEVKRNLFVNSEEVENEEQLIEYPKKSQKQKVFSSNESKGILKEIKVERNKSTAKMMKRKKLDTQMEVLRSLISLGKHLKRYGLNVS